MVQILTLYQIRDLQIFSLILQVAFHSCSLHKSFQVWCHVCLFLLFYLCFWCHIQEIIAKSNVIKLPPYFLLGVLQFWLQLQVPNQFLVNFCIWCKKGSKVFEHLSKDDFQMANQHMKRWCKVRVQMHSFNCGYLLFPVFFLQNCQVAF